MPIRPHLNGHKFDPETIRVMGLAFEMASGALRLLDPGDLAKDVLARKIIELAQAGERDPERLCEGALKEFRARPRGSEAGWPQSGARWRASGTSD